MQATNWWLFNLHVYQQTWSICGFNCTPLRSASSCITWREIIIKRATNVLARLSLLLSRLFRFFFCYFKNLNLMFINRQKFKTVNVTKQKNLSLGRGSHLGVRRRRLSLLVKAKRRLFDDRESPDSFCATTSASDSKSNTSNTQILDCLAPAFFYCSKYHSMSCANSFAAHQRRGK